MYLAIEGLFPVISIIVVISFFCRFEFDVLLIKITLKTIRIIKDRQSACKDRVLHSNRPCFRASFAVFWFVDYFFVLNGWYSAT